MQLLTTEDPRDNLSKLTRWQLVAIAKQHGIVIAHDSPAVLTAAELRKHGITQVDVEVPVLGTMSSGKTILPETFQPEDPEVILKKDFEQEKKAQDVSSMGMNELRAACKEKGIKMVRTDNLKTLRDKLVQNAA